ncbi:MlaD family protein [Pontibacter sp. G13]|uniref:MlaD family protein n=1 Tax=Pontibacter sp. G13 TaxID=3074898 RepID=UPI002889FB9F|nr:MlaD family protein [Pontibacter sp. G13]WNJ20230.1 MlaD family protein [Pontibacter sp. G13]
MKISKEVKFGLFAMITIVMVIYGLNFLGGSQVFGPPLVLYAKYSTVEGLLVGNPVNINGLQVGKVGETKLDMADGTVTIKMEFTQALDIPDNSEAMIYNIDLLGSKGVKILVPAGVPISETNLENEDYIQGTLESGLVDEASKLVMDQGAQILYEVAKLSVDLRQIVGSINELLLDENNSSSIRRIIGNIERISMNLNSVTYEADSIAKNLTSISSDVATTASIFSENNGNINRIINNVATTSDSLSSASTEIKQLMSDAASAVSSVENIVSKLDTTSGTLGLLLNDTQLYDSLVSTTTNLNSLMREVESNPGRFIDDVKIYMFERKPKKTKVKDGSPR